MKVIVIGAGGTIGKAVSEALSTRHEVVKVSRKSGDYKADITDFNSMVRMFEDAAPFQAVVSCAGSGSFKSLRELTDEDFMYSLQDKLMGQVNVVRAGMNKISQGGSFTLTSGILAQEPAPGSAAISLVNAGLEGFGRAAAMELADIKVRVNVVSPPWVTETLIALGMDPSIGMPAASVARAFVESVENDALTGQTIDARKFK